MRLTQITPEIRKRDKLGAAIEYELELDHLGAAVGKRTASVYLSGALAVDIHDVTDQAASRVRGTMLEQLWDDLMATYERLTGEYGDVDLPDEEESGHPHSYLLWGEARGRAQGLAFAIAILVNPLHPDIEAVREEANERWKQMLSAS